jgi:hypothetical protein
MITEIGIIAGQIWELLDGQDQEVSFDYLAGNIDCSKEDLFMSLGWLAREGHVIVKKEDDNYYINLRK